MPWWRNFDRAGWRRRSSCHVRRAGLRLPPSDRVRQLEQTMLIGIIGSSQRATFETLQYPCFESRRGTVPWEAS